MNERIASTERFDYKYDGLCTTLRIPALPDRALGKVCAVPEGEGGRVENTWVDVGKNVSVACKTRASSFLSFSLSLFLVRCKIIVAFLEFLCN